MISDNDLAVLKAFSGQGDFTLSAYLCLDTPEHRASAYDAFLQEIQARLDECAPQPECREALKEDMEIIGLYLSANGHRRHPGLAIFSCAAQLFWRVYPLPVSLPTQVTIGPEFYIEPLVQAT